jgi:hypothetical protein
MKRLLFLLLLIAVPPMLSRVMAQAVMKEFKNLVYVECLVQQAYENYAGYIQSYRDNNGKTNANSRWATAMCVNIVYNPYPSLSFRYKGGYGILYNDDSQRDEMIHSVQTVIDMSGLWNKYSPVRTMIYVGPGYYHTFSVKNTDMTRRNDIGLDIGGKILLIGFGIEGGYHYGFNLHGDQTHMLSIGISYAFGNYNYWK